MIAPKGFGNGDALHKLDARMTLVIIHESSGRDMLHLEFDYHGIRLFPGDKFERGGRVFRVFDVTHNSITFAPVFVLTWSMAQELMAELQARVGKPVEIKERRSKSHGDESGISGSDHGPDGAGIGQNHGNAGERLPLSERGPGTVSSG